ncbi:MAG: alanine racemase, partial [Bacillota bacterium]|nr:alanine racemase [Bacillota bacterium]
MSQCRNEDFWIEVDLDNLRRNYREVKTKIAGRKGVMAVVKADAYGHGMVETAKALDAEGVDFLAVSHFGEGRELREKGITAPILLMAPAPLGYYPEIVKLRLTVAIDNKETLAALSAAAGDEAYGFHLKINTGMNRFGLNLEELQEFLDTLKKYPNLKIAGVFSHIATALIKDHPQTQKQIDKFEEALKIIRTAIDYNFDVHLCNSAGAIACPQARYDYVRVGTILYGQFPAPYLKGSLELVETWRAKARIIEERRAKTGDRVGYGGDYRLKKDRRLGVIPVGYTDGFGIQPPLNNVSFKIFLRQALNLLR